jgi:hypothetical protein
MENPQGQSMFPQILSAIVQTIVVFILYMSVETLYNSYLGYNNARVAVYPVTGSQDVGQRIFHQDPNHSDNVILPQSENQLTGIEFSYSVFLYISPDTDDNTQGWKSVFYKGYETGPFPLCGPGVFVSSLSEVNTGPILRVVMNTYDCWFNYIDVHQIPFRKWFHLAIVLKNNSLEVYINGNLANKKSFNGTLPYQNYQPLCLFPQANYSKAPYNSNDWISTDPTSLVKSIPLGENFIVRGCFTGFISNLYYFSYAMTYSEINSMLNMGPSSVMDTNGIDLPPYLIYTWWTQRIGESTF